MKRVWASATTVAIVAAFGLPVLASRPAGAQSDGSSSTTTSTTSVDSALGTTTTTTPGSTTTVPPREVDPSEDPAPDEGAVPEPPPEEVEVPEAPEEQTVNGVDKRIQYALIREGQRAREVADITERELGDAVHRIAGLTAEEQRIFAEIIDLRRKERATARLAAEARERLIARATSSYVRGPGELVFVLNARDPNEMLHRAALARSVLEADQQGVLESREQHDAMTARIEELVARLAVVRDERRILRNDVNVLANRAARARSVLDMFQAGSLVGIAGFVFPVGDPHQFTDTFGAPRMTGTSYEHTHQGTDIFAPVGTELYAVERGVVTRLGTDVLGGTKLWLVGASGVKYYYAHLSGYAEGLTEGQVVEPGEVVGYVGNTGNARTTPPHLHFEIHPGGGAAVNPYPILAVTDRFQGEYRAGEPAEPPADEESRPARS